MESWSEKHEPALRNGLDIHDKGQSMRDIAAIAATEKTWAHRFIDRHRRLHSLFVKVSAILLSLQGRPSRFYVYQLTCDVF
jgi:hypothetical protein